MLYLFIYIIGLFVFNLWDAFIGFGFEFETDIAIGPTAWSASIFWPVSFPIFLVMALGNSLNSIKEKRIEKQEKNLLKKEEIKKIRIAAEKETEVIFNQLDQEMDHVKAQATNAR